MLGLLACSYASEFGQLRTGFSTILFQTRISSFSLEPTAYGHSRKPDLPVTQSSPFSTWLSVLFFLFLLRKNHTVRGGLWVLLMAVVTLPSKLPYSHHLLCIVLKTSNSLWILSILFFMLAWGFGFWVLRLTLALWVFLFLLSAEYFVVMCGAWHITTLPAGALVTWQ